MTTMIMKEYCDRMDRTFDAWQANVEKLLLIAERLPGKDPREDARQRERLQTLITDIGRVSKNLRRECMPA